ncbi:MAG: hypothetical protein PUK74_01100 [Elusimicrobia bacterium]|nr:hypothetical protein [Elusimicrobiota bacterium]MDY5729166.1 hypothetical protein [Elusimicrobiaceae bacterium]
MPANFNLKNNKIVENLKKGFQDMQTVAQEGNFKLFAKQIVAVVLVFFLFRYLSGKFTQQENNFRGQMEAIRVQQTSEREYQANKEKLISLEPRFPNIAEKNEWLLSQILGIFKAADLTPQMEGGQTEDASNATFVAASLRAGSEMSWPKFTEFLAGIESYDDYVKVSEFSLEKNTDPNQLGNNKVSLRFNTVFPKEKIAKSLFKDYDKIVKAQQEAKKKAQTANNTAKGGAK